MLHDMQFDILTIFPEIITDYCQHSILGRARKKKLIKIIPHNFRDYTADKHRHVDDRSYGGGPGMILKIQPVYDCLQAMGVLSLRGARRRGSLLTPPSIPPLIGEGQGVGYDSPRGAKRPHSRNDKMKVIILDPAGKKFDQKMAQKFSKLDRLVLIAGRYEGFDARIYKLADERVSVGDYVLAGGELAALTVIEAVARLVPGVLGNLESLKEESFNTLPSIPPLKGEGRGEGFRLKEYPQYTRPENFMGWKVPKVLLLGDHKKIARWRSEKQK